MHHFSILDLCSVVEGQTTADALANTVSLAQAAETIGYHRYWLAEHHNTPAIASAATSIVIGQVAGATQTMRIGAGGIMLPNHAPLVVAEQFGTLATLFPDRIDLGLGRAPGTDMQTARALRRHMDSDDYFPQDVQELLHYFSDTKGPVQAIPGMGTDVPIWILGSSLYGAQLAAHMGLPYAFASHFAPAMLEQASAAYRDNFQPSDALSKPYFMMTASVCAADSDAEAIRLRTSQQLAFAGLFTGNRGKLPRPVDDLAAHYPAHVMDNVNDTLACSATGSPDAVRAKLEQIISTYQPDELLLTGMIHDHDARLKSFEITADILHGLTTESAAA